jgi:hypothetical protein
MKTPDRSFMKTIKTPEKSPFVSKIPRLGGSNSNYASRQAVTKDLKDSSFTSAPKSNVTSV